MNYLLSKMVQRSRWPKRGPAKNRFALDGSAACTCPDLVGIGCVESMDYKVNKMCFPKCVDRIKQQKHNECR